MDRKCPSCGSQMNVRLKLMSPPPPLTNEDFSCPKGCDNHTVYRSQSDEVYFHDVGMDNGNIILDD